MGRSQQAATSADSVKIDTQLIPTHVRDELSRFALSLVDECFSQPGAEKRYQEWLKERKKRLHTASRKEERQLATV